MSAAGADEDARAGDPVDAVAVLFEADDQAPLATALVRSARERAEALGRALGDDKPSRRAAAVDLAARTLSGLWLEREWSQPTVTDVVDGVASAVQLPATIVRFVLYQRASSDDDLLALPPVLAVQAQLGLLHAFARLTAASLWTPSGERGVALAAHVGGEPTRSARAAARDVLVADEPELRARRTVHAVPVLRWEQPYAALVAVGPVEDGASPIVFATEAAARLRAVLEIETLLARNAEHERSLVESGERRLVRLALDIHDGPLQDLAALLSDVRLFRRQLADVVAGHEHGKVILGRVDDLEGRLRALDGEFRDISRSLEPPRVLGVSFRELVEREVEMFSRRTDVSASLRMDGDFDSLTASQRIALLRVVQEALSNVRQHSGATHVEVTLDLARSSVRATIRDDGVGFEVERTLVAAARRGRLGLVGMDERMRLLGGRFDVRSRPGGPTVVSAVVPRWTPVAASEET